MSSRDNVHSRLVAWLKVLLPLAALGILSTLFLFSHTIDPSRAIPYAKIDVKKLAEEPQVTAPDYAGVTQDGTAITVTAAVAKPEAGGSGAMDATRVAARLEAPDGQVTHIDAGQGALEPGGKVVDLSGGVTVRTPTGYRIDTSALTGALDRTHLQSAGRVTAEGPLGHLEAGGMVIEAPADGNGGAGPYVLVFNGGVKLVYQPSDKGK